VARDLRAAQPKKLVVGDRGHDRGRVLHQHRVRAEIVEDLVVGNGQGRAGIDAAFFAETDHRIVTGVGALLDQVVLDDGVAAVGQVDVVAGGAAGAVDDGVAGDGGVERAALDVMADIGVGEIAVGDRELLDVADIERVGKAVAGAVAAEHRIVDRDGAACDRAAQDAVLVVEKLAIVDGQIAALITDAGAVAVADRGAREGDVIERDVGIGDQDRFAVGNGAAGHQIDLAADALDRDLGADLGKVVGVGAGLNLNDVAVMRGGNGCRERTELLAGADGKNSHAMLPR